MSEHVSEETAVAEEGVEGAVEPSGSEEIPFPDFDVELPPELVAELAEPEIEDVTDDEVESYVEEYGEENRELAARMLAAEKKAAHFERLRQQEAKKNWQAEAEKFFPLSAPLLDAITATSRRGYLNAAKDIHNKLKPSVEAQVRAAFERSKTAQTVAETEPETDPKEAWRNSGLSDQTEPVPTPEFQPRPRRRGDLADNLRTMMFGGRNGQ